MKSIVSVIGNEILLSEKYWVHFGRCPFHNDTLWLFIVSEWYWLACCPYCKKVWTALSFLADYKHITYYEAYCIWQSLPEDNNWKIPYVDIHKEVLSYQKDYEWSPAQKYMESRWVDNETANHFSLGYATKGKFQWRVIFPIKNVYWQFVGITARTLTNENPKYINSSNSNIFQKKRCLYGFNTDYQFNYNILVEWQMDVIKLHSKWYINAVCSSGTGVNRDQLIKMKEIVICLDNDEAGKLATKRTAELCDELHIPYSFADLGEYKDPDEYISNGWDISVAIGRYFPEAIWDIPKNSIAPAMYSLIDQEEIEKLLSTRQLLPLLSDEVIRRVIDMCIHYRQYREIVDILQNELFRRSRTYREDEITIESLKASIPIEVLVESYIGQIPKVWNIKCPLPDHWDTTASFNINRSKWLFKCFGCNKWWSHIDFIMEMDKCDLKTAIHKLKSFS